MPPADHQADLNGRLVWIERNPERGLDHDLLERGLAFYGLEGSDKVRALLVEAAAWHARQLPYVIVVEGEVASVRVRAKGRCSPPLVGMTSRGLLLEGTWGAETLVPTEPPGPSPDTPAPPQNPGRPDFNAVAEAIYEAIAGPGRPVPLRPPPAAPIELVWQDGPDGAAILSCHVRFRGGEQPPLVFRHELSHDAIATQPEDVIVVDHPPDPPRAFVGPVLDRRVAFLPANAAAAFEMAANLKTLAERASDGPARRNTALRELAVRHGDADAVDIMRQLGWRHAEGYRWLAAGGDPERALRRRQAAIAFPALVAILPSTTGEEADGISLNDTVDQGSKLTLYLRRRLRCSAAAVATLAKTGCGLTPLNAHDLERAAALLDAVPADRHPGRAPGGIPMQVQWAVFDTLARRLPRALVARIAASGPPPWFAPPMREGVFEAQLSHLTDCLSAAVRQVVLPALWERRDDLLGVLEDRRVLDAIIGQRGWGALQEGAERWMHSLAQIRAAAGAGGGLSWLALSDPFSVGGYEVVPITTSDDLEREGDVLGHCAGSYAGDCAEGAVHMVSVRTPDGTPMSTAAIAVHWDVEPVPLYEMLQHRGRRNLPAPPALCGAVDSYFEALCNGRIHVDVDAHRARRGAILREQESDPLVPSVGVIGYDFRDAAARERVYEAWKVFLPRADRGLSYRDWLLRHGFPLHGS